MQATLFVWIVPLATVSPQMGFLAIARTVTNQILQRNSGDARDKRAP